MSQLEDLIADANAERDRILIEMDVDAAQAFIATYGGFVPRAKSIDWLRVLHLARFEVQTIPPDLITASQIYLAKTGAESVATLPETSPYLRAAMDLIFPKSLTDRYIREVMPR